MYVDGDDSVPLCDSLFTPKKWLPNHSKLSCSNRNKGFEVTKGLCTLATLMVGNSIVLSPELHFTCGKCTLGD